MLKKKWILLLVFCLFNSVMTYCQEQTITRTEHKRLLDYFKKKATANTIVFIDKNKDTTKVKLDDVWKYFKEKITLKKRKDFVYFEDKDLSKEERGIKNNIDGKLTLDESFEYARVDILDLKNSDTKVWLLLKLANKRLIEKQNYDSVFIKLLIDANYTINEIKDIGQQLKACDMIIDFANYYGNQSLEVVFEYIKLVLLEIAKLDEVEKTLKQLEMYEKLYFIFRDNMRIHNDAYSNAKFYNDRMLEYFPN